MRPIFSIIIPSFNSQSSISKCLESIINQSFESYEVLIVDGKSTDGTLERIKRFKDIRIRVFSEQDFGVYDAMNKGIKLAKGDWLYFLGSDDQLFDEKVLEDINFFIQSKLEINVLYGNVSFSGVKPSWASQGEIYDGEFNFEKLQKKNICHQSIFYQRSFIVNNNFEYSLQYPVCGDWDFNLKCWLNSPFHYIERNVCLFAGGGISSNNTDDFANDFNYLILKYQRKYFQYWIKKLILKLKIIFR